jgi:hypothetical protein
MRLRRRKFTSFYNDNSMGLCGKGNSSCPWVLMKLLESDERSKIPSNKN